MADLLCYRCGKSLESLTLPLARLDLCPACTVELHCCRMCVYFDPQVPKQCTEDDAEEVKEKARANFCDYFAPAEGRFDADGAVAEARAKNELEALFGDGNDAADDDDPASSDAEDLFR